MIPPEIIDAWLLREFPGRTLEELDEINFVRLWRALLCKTILKAEDIRELQMQGKYTPTEDEWREILRNDQAISSQE